MCSKLHCHSDCQCETPDLRKGCIIIPGSDLVPTGQQTDPDLHHLWSPHTCYHVVLAPCNHNHSNARYNSCSTNEEAFILDPDSTVGNRIESLTQRTAIIEGKNKTSSTLVVADARISGIYTCMATNKVGTVERNMNFTSQMCPMDFM